MGGTACEIARLASTKPCESASERSAAAQTTIPLRRDSFALAVGAGLLLSIPIWVVGQDLGQLYSGQATDPGSAPLIALMAIALLFGRKTWSARR